MVGAESPAWVYEKNQVPAMFEPWARKLIALAQPELGDHVLDAACGTGIVARLTAPLVGKSGSVTGLDFDPAMLAVARELAPLVDWQQGDLQQLPFADARFDVVMCHQGLQFAPDRAAALREMYRVLKPGGRLVLGLWTELAHCPGQATLFGALGKMLNQDMSRPPPWSLTDGDEIRKLLIAAGLTEFKITTASLPAKYPSARRFVEILIEGTSKLTRQVLEQIPSDRKEQLIDDVVERLRLYETRDGFQVPNESRLVIAHKRPENVP